MTLLELTCRHPHLAYRIWPVPLSAMLLAGCITVNAPEEPIVIELNINIKQEVIYRLAEDAGSAIEQNQEIF
ncbi:YnbE family lipoprotein [Croceibacterium sp. TMG7-5b_MA50]|uniref:YnbE family lipoprotein n=1 Tax=Croceibacterium sp. TMG7-5b_MA50 TaxID=3121290 RepID=UPI0032214E7B